MNDDARIPALDGLRGIACLLVVYTHMLYYGWAPSPGAHTGSLGVSVFFALSGFLMALIFVAEKPLLKHGAAFYIRRLFRIYPMLIVATMLLYLMLITDTIVYQTPSMRVAVPPLDPGILRDQLWFQKGWGVVWTIPVEVHFYFIFPLLMWFINCLPCPLKTVKQHHWQLFLLLIIAAFSVYHLNTWHARLTDFMVPDVSIYPLVWRYMGGFIAGMAAGFAYRHFEQDLRRVQWLWDALTITAAVFIVICLFPPTNQWLNETGFLQKYLWSQKRSATLFIAFIILAVALARRPYNLLFTNRATRFTGRISYSLYLLHPIMFNMTYLYVPEALQLPCALFGSFAISYLAFRFIEKPAIHTGHRLATRVEEG